MVRLVKTGLKSTKGGTVWSKDAHHKGALNEKKAQLYFMEHGCDVFIPCHGGTRCDFIATDEKGQVSRIQVKTAQYNGDYIQSRLDVKGKRYTEKDTDFVVFVLDKRMWVVPIHAVSGKSSVCLGKVNDPDYKSRNDLSYYEVS